MRRTGTYTHTNGAVTMTWASYGDTDLGSIVDSQLTLTDDGNVFSYSVLQIAGQSRPVPPGPA